MAILIGQLLPWLGAINSIYSLISGIGANNRAKQAYQNAMNVPTLSYQDAMTRAADVLNPIWDKNMQQTMQAMDNANMARGFYGQLAGDALRSSRAADVQQQRTGQVSALANQMVGQSEQNALAQQQLAMQYAANMGQLGLAQIAQGISGAYEGAKDWGNMIGYNLDQLSKDMDNIIKTGQSLGLGNNQNYTLQPSGSFLSPSQKALSWKSNPITNGSLSSSFQLQLSNPWVI